MYCEKCGMHVQDGSERCLCCGNSMIVSHEEEREYLSMKWYNFQIWFRLWAGAVLNILTGVLLLVSSTQNNYPYLSDTMANKLSTLAIFEALLSFALAVLCIITRFQLSGYKKNAGTWACWNELAPFIVTVFISLMTVMTMGSSSIDILSSSASAAPALVLFFANRRYFNRRAHLFDN